MSSRIQTNFFKGGRPGSGAIVIILKFRLRNGSPSYCCHRRKTPSLELEMTVRLFWTRFSQGCVLLPTNADRSHSATSSSRTRSALAPSAGRRLAAADSAGPDCGGPLGPSRVPDASWRTSRRRSLCNVEISLRRTVKSEIGLSQPELRTRSLG